MIENLVETHNLGNHGCISRTYMYICICMCIFIYIYMQLVYHQQEEPPREPCASPERGEARGSHVQHQLHHDGGLLQQCSLQADLS